MSKKWSPSQQPRIRLQIGETFLGRCPTSHPWTQEESTNSGIWNFSLWLHVLCRLETRALYIYTTNYSNNNDDNNNTYNTYTYIYIYICIYTHIQTIIIKHIYIYVYYDILYIYRKPQMCDPCLTSNVILTHPTPINHRDCYHEPFSFDFFNQPAQNPINLNTKTIMNQSGKSLSTCIECILPETSKEELNKPQRTTMLHSKRFLKRQSRGRVLSKNMVVILP